MDTTPPETPNTTALKHSLLKGYWILLICLGFIAISTVIFQGIEGHGFTANNYKLLDEQQQFNQSYSADIPSEEFQVFYSRVEDIMKVKCKLEKLTLTGWNNKTVTDAMVYSVTIVTTLGYGVFYPKSTLARAVSMLYAVVGIPLFAILVGDFVVLLNALEARVRNSEWIKKWFRNCNFFLSLLCKMFLCWVTLNSWMVSYYYMNYSPSSSKFGAHLLAAGVEYKWSIWDALYWFGVSFTLVGFGDMYIYEDSHAVKRRVILHFMLFIQTPVVLAVMKRMFDAMSNSFDNSLNKKIIKFQQDGSVESGSGASGSGASESGASGRGESGSGASLFSAPKRNCETDQITSKTMT